MDGSTIFVLCCVAALVWLIYMATFRTDDFLRICKEDRERRARQRETFGKVFKAGTGIAKFVGRRKGWW